jgi:hypothetical protein
MRGVPLTRISPSRLAEPGSCGVTLKRTVRVPLPPASVMNEIQDALLVALHEQSPRVATLKEPVPPDAGILKLVGLTSYVQGSGAASICETVNVWRAIVSVPVRGVVPLSVALNSTEPLPVPLAPDVIVSHGTLLVAVHGQRSVAVTVTGPPGPPPAASVRLVGLIAYVQATCEMVKVCPAIVRVPFRGAAVVLGVPLNSTEPVPVPLAPDVTVSHVAVLVAVHGQDAEVVTVTALPAPPPAATAWLVGLIAYVQAICETVKVWPAIASVPLRGAVVLSVALNSTEPLPIPLAPDVIVSHGTLLVAVHGQCAAVVTVTGLPGKTPAASVWLVELIAYVQAGGAGGGVGEGGAGEGGAGEGGVGEGGAGEGGVGEGGVGGGGASEMPRWMTVCVRSAMVTVPVRLLLPLLALTRYSTLPLPAPAVPEVIVIHSALLRAVHLHASCVETTMLAVPESADNVRRS